MHIFDFKISVHVVCLCFGISILVWLKLPRNNKKNFPMKSVYPTMAHGFVVSSIIIIIIRPLPIMRSKFYLCYKINLLYPQHYV